jgi:predicted PhzF superfamily epimerase YddE/YHI9
MSFACSPSHRRRLAGGRWIEDVATGSAAGPLAAHLAPFHGTFAQGSTRRAHIRVKSTAREGARVEIGGGVLRVASGTWTAIPSDSMSQ